MATNKNTSEYIQFSKKVTQWGIIAISLGLFLCLLILTIFKVSEEIILFSKTAKNRDFLLDKSKNSSIMRNMSRIFERSHFSSA